jgi:hypothetical protein
MATKKPAAKQATHSHKNAHQSKSSPPKAKSKGVWIWGIALAVLIIGGFALSGKAKDAGTPAGQASAGPTADEAKYLNRFLPEWYVAPKVADGGAVSADTPMTPIAVKSDATGFSVAVADIATNRNVAFEYQKADGTPIPMIAYVRPSGKVFVGVSYCVPCKGTGQTLTTDGNLTCDSCGTKRDPESGTGISGACRLYPLDELPSKVEGDRLVIDKGALDGWTVQPLDRPVGG